MSEVLLLRQGNLVKAIPQQGITVESLFRLLRDNLRYSLRVRNDRRTAQVVGRKFSSEYRYLCRLENNQHHQGVLFSAGLSRRASILLSKYKIGWSMKDLRPRLLPDPDINNMELDKLREREDQRECLAVMFQSDMGVVEAPTAYGKTFLIGQVCRAYPKSPIVICSYRRDVVNSIFARLRQSKDVPFHELGRVGGGFRRPNRVTVSTIDSLEHAPINDCRLFMYDEVHEAGSEERMRKLATVRMSRMFGFSASPKGRTDGADMAIEAMFGPIIYRLPYQEAEAKGRVATITVDIYRIPGAAIPYDDDVQRYRHGIWRNDYRNRVIAKAAAQHAVSGKQVLIMVDKVEHALFIKRRCLPTWPIVHGSVQAEQVRSFRRMGLLPDPNWLCTSERRESYRKRFERGHMRFAIATGVWSQGVDFVHLDVLARLDAQSAPIPNTQLPGRLARGEAGLLLDCEDVFDERFQKNSHTRFRHYKSKGWKLQYK